MFRILIGLCVITVALADTVYQSGVSLPDGRIVGGKDVKVHDYPHQVSMRYRSNHRCGGSIIADNIIVSAAHCLNTLTSAENLTISAGSTSLFFLDAGSQVLPVKKFILHDKYNSMTQNNDAAVLFLDGHLEFNDVVQPISLATERPKSGTPVEVTGWGATAENGYLANILQKVEVNVVDNKDCKKKYPLTLTDNMLCAGVTGGGKDSCQGDSGGPLIYNNQLLGIVSWGKGCARPNYPGVYASVPEVKKWIEATIKAYDANN